MLDTIKKTLFAGFGAAVVTKDAIEDALRGWIEKGKITPEEAREFAGKLARTGEERWEKAKDGVAAGAADLFAKAPFARRSELAALDARIAVLEQAALRAQFPAAPGAPSE